MRQFKISVALLLVTSCVVTWFLYYWDRITVPSRRAPLSEKVTTEEYTDRPMIHVPLNEVYADFSRQYPNGSFELDDTKPAQMLNTPGCQIPLSMINYAKNLKKNKSKTTCGKRAVFMKKIDKNLVQAFIKPKIIKTYLRKSINFDCRYRFFDGSTGVNRFTKFVKFHDSDIITLQTDFIHVRCYDSDKKNIYDDVYAFAKRINLPKQNDCKTKYNVLMIGMDSMSLPRFSMSLSRTANTLKENSWLGYRGYHKVADNTLPNLMPVLTGKNLTIINKMCSGKMSHCQKMMIWDKFKKAGYVTAFGEDYLRLPEIFNGNYSFKSPPTDHYMRPLFLKGETETGSLVCAGKVSSGQQILNYALDFVNTYRNDPFFGLFWMNSYSHNENNQPHDADVILDNFLNQIYYTGLLQNTFVIIFSDHGLRFGEHRVKVQSYYDERLPILFIWPPLKFKGREAHKLKSLINNQYKLVTPYDLHNTIVHINKLSTCKNYTAHVAESCSKCHSLFEEVSGNRTCQDVGINTKWCSCHKLYPLPVQDAEGRKSVEAVVSKINSRLKTIQTKRCWSCMNVSLLNIIRIHFYYNTDKINLIYVVAFTVRPTNVSYEATVIMKDGNREVTEPISIISPHHGMLGECTIHANRDRHNCKCVRQENC